MADPIGRLLVLSFLFALQCVAFAGSRSEIDLFGFRPGMSEREALALADNAKLDEEDWLYFVVPGVRKVFCMDFSILGLQKIARASGARADTFDDLAQSIANEVGDLTVHTETTYTERQYYSWEKRGNVSRREWYERKLIDGSALTLEEREDCLACRIDGPDALVRQVRGAALGELLSGFARIGDEPVPSSEISHNQYQYIGGRVPDRPPEGFAQSRRKHGKRGGDEPAHVSGWGSIQRFCNHLNETEEVKDAGLFFSPPEKAEWEKESGGKPAPFKVFAEKAGVREKRIAREEEERERRREESERIARIESEKQRKAREEKVRQEHEQALSALVSDMVPIPAKKYLIGKYEVTQGQWEAVMGADANPSRTKGADLPVENVSRAEVETFLGKLNEMSVAKESGFVFQLPSREEWRRACLAGAPGPGCRLENRTTVTQKTFGEAAWFKDNSGGKTHPVGRKAPNAYGIHDMHGNVSEWTRTNDGTGSKQAIFMGENYSSAGCGTMYSWSSPEGQAAVASSWGVSNERQHGVGFRLCATKRKP